MPVRKPGLVEKLKKKARKIKPGQILQGADRLTIYAQIHHEHLGSDPIHIPIQFSKLLKTQRQPFVRRITVPADPIPLEIGFMSADEVWLVIIENRTGKGMLVNPSKEVRDSIPNQIVEVSFGDSGGWLIEPGLSFVGAPSDASKIRMRALDKPVEVNVYLIPR